jgi:hypothetical protein
VLRQSSRPPERIPSKSISVRLNPQWSPQPIALIISNAQHRYHTFRNRVGLPLNTRDIVYYTYRMYRNTKLEEDG